MGSRKLLANSEDSIRRGYEAVLEKCARIISFSSSLPLLSDTDIDSRQIALAIDDLISLSLHARRLIADVKFIEAAKKAELQSEQYSQMDETIHFTKTGPLISIWDILNIIIHNEFIEIYRRNYDLLEFSGDRDERLIQSYNQLIKETKASFFPKMAIKSNHFDLIMIDIQFFITAFLESIFNPIVQKCEDNEIYLSKSF